MNSKPLLLVVCVVSFVIQLALWHFDSFTDEYLWVTRIVHLREDFSRPIPIIIDVERYSGHPGMTAVLPAGLLHILGVPALESLRITVSLLVAVTATAIAAITRSLRPTSWWWLVTTSTVTFHPLFLHASPTNAIEAPLIVLVFLLTLFIYERRQLSSYQTLLLGGALGLMLATRLPLGAVTIAFTLLFLLRTVSFKKLCTVLVVSLCTFVIADPLMWFSPLVHIQHMLFRMSLHITTITTTRLQASDFFLFAPLTYIAIALTVLFQLGLKRISSPLPRLYIFYLWIVTGIMVSIFLNAKSQSLRYFLPFIFIWETFLPLFILHIIAQIQPSFTNNGARAHRILSIAAALFLVGGQLLLIVYSLHLPKSLVVVTP